MDKIQKTALVKTAKTVVGLTVLAVAVPTVLFLVPMQILGTALAFGALCFAVKMIYDTNLAQAKFDAEYNKTVD